MENGKSYFKAAEHWERLISCRSLKIGKKATENRKTHIFAVENWKETPYFTPSIRSSVHTYPLCLGDVSVKKYVTRNFVARQAANKDWQAVNHDRLLITHYLQET